MMRRWIWLTVCPPLVWLWFGKINSNWSTLYNFSIGIPVHRKTQLFCTEKYYSGFRLYELTMQNLLQMLHFSAELPGQTCSLSLCISCDSPPGCRSSFVQRCRCLIFDTLQRRLIADDITGCRHQFPELAEEADDENEWKGWDGRGRQQCQWSCRRW